MRRVEHGVSYLDVVVESSRVMLTYSDSGNIVMLSPKYADIGQAKANAEEISVRCRYHDRLVEALIKAVSCLKSAEVLIESEYGSSRDIEEMRSDGDLPDGITESESLLAELSAHNGGEE